MYFCDVVFSGGNAIHAVKWGARVNVQTTRVLVLWGNGALQTGENTEWDISAVGGEETSLSKCQEVMVKGEVRVRQEVVHTGSEGETSEGNTGVVSKTVSEENRGEDGEWGVIQKVAVKQWIKIVKEEVRPRQEQGNRRNQEKIVVLIKLEKLVIKGRYSRTIVGCNQVLVFSRRCMRYGSGWTQTPSGDSAGAWNSQNAPVSWPNSPTRCTWITTTTRSVYS